MKHESGRKQLLSFAQSEYSDENMLFWTRASCFRSKFIMCDDEEPGVAEEMFREAKEIVAEFLCDGAETPVTLPGSNPFKRQLTADSPVAPNMFDSMSRIIYKAIEHDTFRRFKLTAAARDLVAMCPTLAGRLSGNRSSRGSRSSAGSESEESPASRRGGGGGCPRGCGDAGGSPAVASSRGDASHRSQDRIAPFAVP